MNFEPRQFFAYWSFIAFMCAVATSFPSMYVYLGFSVAIATITIGIQQFYIYSRVETNLQFERKEFYRSASYALLIYGPSLLSHTISLIIKGDTSEYGVLAANKAVLFYQIATLFSALSAIPLTSLVISYLFPLADQKTEDGESSPERGGGNGKTSDTRNPRSGRGSWIGVKSVLTYFLMGEIGLLKNSEMHSTLVRCLSVAWFVMVALIWGWVGLLAVEIVGGHHWVFAATVVDGSSYFLASQTLEWLPFRLNWLRPYLLWHLIFLLALAISLVAVAHRGSRLIAGAVQNEGFAMFIAFLAFFALPPVLQYSTLSSLGTTLAVLFIVVGAVWLVSLYRRYRDTFASLQAPTSYQRRSQFYWWLFVGLLAFAAVALLLFGFEVFPQSDNGYPLVFFTAAFLTFGCTWMITVDLGTAAKAHNLLMGEFLSGLAIKKIGHELYNQLLPVRGFVTDQELKQLLAHEVADDPDLDDARRSLSGLLPGVRESCDKLVHFTNELKNFGRFATVPATRQIAIKLVNRFVQKYQYSQTQYKYNLQSTVEPRARDTMVRCNPEVFDGVLRLLVDNAVEASVVGRCNEISIHVDVAGGQLVLTITDMGGGMAPPHRNRFGQGQQSMKPDGSGIGTAIAVGWLRQMQGTAIVEESSPGGTRIRITLPLD